MLSFLANGFVALFAVDAAVAVLSSLVGGLGPVHETLASLVFTVALLVQLVLATTPRLPGRLLYPLSMYPSVALLGWLGAEGMDVPAVTVDRVAAALQLAVAIGAVVAARRDDGLLVRVRDVPFFTWRHALIATALYGVLWPSVYFGAAVGVADAVLVHQTRGFLHLGFAGLVSLDRTYGHDADEVRIVGTLRDDVDLTSLPTDATVMRVALTDRTRLLGDPATLRAIADALGVEAHFDAVAGEPLASAVGNGELTGSSPLPDEAAQLRALAAAMAKSGTAPDGRHAGFRPPAKRAAGAQDPAAGKGGTVTDGLPAGSNAIGGGAAGDDDPPGRAQSRAAAVSPGVGSVPAAGPAATGPGDAGGAAASAAPTPNAPAAPAPRTGPEVLRADVDLSDLSAQTVVVLRSSRDLLTGGDPTELLTIADDPSLEAHLAHDLVELPNEHLLAALDAALLTRDRVVVPWSVTHLPALHDALLARGFTAEEETPRVVLRWKDLAF
jgi:hypothetical protein